MKEEVNDQIITALRKQMGEAWSYGLPDEWMINEKPVTPISDYVCWIELADKFQINYMN